MKMNNQPQISVLQKVTRDEQSMKKLKDIVG